MLPTSRIYQGAHVPARRTAHKLTLAIAAAAIAVAALAAGPVTGSAEAYDKGTCDGIFGAANVSTTQFKIDTGSAGKVDFGDLLHLGGVPQGTAVICWQTGTRRVAVRGVLFADDIDTVGEREGDVAMRITFFSGGTSLGSKKLGAQNAVLGYSTMRHTTPGGPITKVRIELFRGSQNPADGVLVYTDDISRCLPAGQVCSA